MMLLSYTIVDFYLNGAADMQICTLLTRIQYKVYDTQVTVRPVGLLLLIKNIPLQKGDTCMQFLEHIASSLDYLAIIFDKQFKCFTLTVFAERTLWVTCMHCLNFIMFSIRSLCCRQYCVLRYKTEV